MKHAEDLIIKELIKGNEGAYKYLYQKHYKILCHIADELVKDSFIAETIVGDVIFHIWEIHEQLEINISLRAYLTQAVRNKCKDYLTSSKVQNEIVFSMIEEDENSKARYIYSDETPLGSLLEQELETEIYCAINELPQECKTVFLKSRFEGKKYEEISKEIGISTNTVKYHIKNALEILHKKLQKYLLIFLLLFLC